MKIALLSLFSPLILNIKGRKSSCWLKLGCWDTRFFLAVTLKRSQHFTFITFLLIIWYWVARKSQRKTHFASNCWISTICRVVWIIFLSPKVKAVVVNKWYGRQHNSFSERLTITLTSMEKRAHEPHRMIRTLWSWRDGLCINYVLSLVCQELYSQSLNPLLVALTTYRK